MDLLERDLSEVYKQYSEVYKQYKATVEGYWEVLEDNRLSDDYKLEQREEAYRQLMDLKVNTANEALEKITKLEEEYKKKGDHTEAKKESDMDKLRNVILWKEILPNISKADYKELYIKHRENEDFMMLSKKILTKENKNIWIDELDHIYAHNPLKERFNNEKLRVRSARGLGDTFTFLKEDGSVAEMRNIKNDLNKQTRGGFSEGTWLI